MDLGFVESGWNLVKGKIDSLRSQVEQWNQQKQISQFISPAPQFLSPAPLTLGASSPQVTPAQRVKDKFEKILTGTPAPTVAPTTTPIPTPTPHTQFGRVTYYQKTGNLTSTGTVPKPNYTAAISRELKKVVPMGSIIELPDGTRFRIEDLTAEEIENKETGERTPIRDTLDLFRDQPGEGEGLQRNVPYKVVGRDTAGLKYNY